jgi:RNA polymerase sigma factor (sigma-70 family)
MQIQIEPLTHQSLDGKTYQRTQEVEAQIVEAIQLERPALIDRITIMDFKATGFFQEECLVYLIRRSLREGDYDLVSSLLSRLVMRISKKVNGVISKHLGRHYVDECFDDVIHEVTCRLIDPGTDKDDFAQVRFWVWLQARTLNVLRNHLKVQERGDLTDSLNEVDRADHEGADLKDNTQLLELQAMGAEAYKLLDKLTKNEQTAFLLRHYEGWEIENKDPSVMTISRFFERTPKTIRNWLNSAEEKLQKWQGGQQ